MRSIRRFSSWAINGGVDVVLLSLLQRVAACLSAWHRKEFHEVGQAGAAVGQTLMQSCLVPRPKTHSADLTATPDQPQRG